MTRHFKLFTLLSTLLYLLVADLAHAQCVDVSERTEVAAGWRPRLAPWVPDVTLELSNELGTRLETGRHALEPTAEPSPDTSDTALYDQRARTWDWQVAAHWNVVEIVESLTVAHQSPLPAEHRECADELGAPLPEYIEEEQ